MTVKIFPILDTGFESASLRRYASGSTCSEVDGNGYHNAHTALGRRPAQKHVRSFAGREEAYAHSDKWPTHCACGYEFVDEDDYQEFTQSLYADISGKEWSLRDAPPGAYWFAPWIFNSKAYQDPNHPKHEEEKLRRQRGLEGKSHLAIRYYEEWAAIRDPVVVSCPNGDEWLIDSIANNGPGWTVTGQLPLITVSPSIQTGRYHGFLQEGVFTADCERPDAPNGVDRNGNPA